MSEGNTNQKDTSDPTGVSGTDGQPRRLVEVFPGIHVF